MASINMDLNSYQLQGDMQIPSHSNQLVIFAHGSGSSRLSSRNRQVAQALNDTGISTCLFDLLTANEENIDLITREFRFNIPLLAERLIAATYWLQENYSSYGFNMGYFGSSTGAAAALIASTKCKEIKAIVSRGGRPDLAKDSLKQVMAATLLVIGELDEEVIVLNEEAFLNIQAAKEIAIVPQATHLFEEPGALNKVTQLAISWFKTYL